MVKDWAYLAAFKRKDLPSLYEMVAKINETHDTDLIESFNEKCEQKINCENTSLPFEQVIKSDDLVVTAGLQQNINIILGTSATRWQYMRHGIGGSTAATIAQTALTTEGAGPIDMATFAGWREPVGMKLYFGGILGETVAVTNITEAGVFNASVAGIMLNRNCFPNNSLQRSLNTLVFIISSVIEFCPVT